MKLKCGSYVVSIIDLSIFIAFFLIYIGQCGAVNQYGNLIVYAGLFIILFGSYLQIFRNIRSINRVRITKNLAEFLFVLSLLSIGILMQDIAKSKKIVLILSYFIIASVFVFSGYWLKNIRKMRIASYGMLTALLFGIILSIITHNDIFMSTSEGFLKYGFTGGFGHKNSFSASLLAIFSGFYLFYIGEERHKKECILLFALGALIFLTASRTGWIMLFMMLITSRWKIINKITPRMRLMFKAVVIGSGILVGIIFIYAFVMNSTTFSHRLHGITPAR